MPNPDNISARFDTPRFIERGKAIDVTMPLYSDGALVVPASGTYTLYDSSYNEVLDAVAVTITASIATYSIAAVSLPASLTLSDSFLEVWSLTLSGGEVVTVRRPVALVLRALYPVLTHLDLYRRHSDLNPSAAASIVASGTTHQDQIDEGWAIIQGKLISAGNYPYLILDSWALREPHLYLTLSIIFRDLMLSANDGKWGELATLYEDKFDAAWKGLTFRYDSDSDGQIADDAAKIPSVAVYYLSKAG